MPDDTPITAPDERAILRLAADYYGAERLAEDIGVASRTLYSWMSGDRTPRSWAEVLGTTRKLLIARRQAITALVRIMSATEAEL